MFWKRFVLLSALIFIVSLPGASPGRAAQPTSAPVRLREGVAVPVTITTRIERVAPASIPLPVMLAFRITGTVKGEFAGLPVTGRFSVYMVQASVPVVVLSVPVHKRTTLEPTVLETPAGNVVVYGAVSGNKMEKIFVETDPAKGTGAFAGIAGRGTLDARRIFRGGGEFEGEVVMSWGSGGEALQAVVEALGANPRLGEKEREDLAARAGDTLSGASVKPFPPSPLASSPPEGQRKAPEGPQVAWEGEAKGQEFSGVVRVTVPRGPEEQQVRVLVVEPAGAREVHRGLHRPAEEVNVQVSGRLPAVIQVYLDNLLIAEIKPGESS